jgi:hypothetical protein
LQKTLLLLRKVDSYAAEVTPAENENIYLQLLKEAVKMVYRAYSMA